MYGLRAVLAVAVALGAATPATSQVSGPSYAEPVGIALETMEYPFPVAYLPLEVASEPVRMAYMDVAPTGTANGRTVVLLHGKNFFGHYWAGTARALAAAGYRVVIPDQIGFGKSSKPDVDYSFDMLAANTAALLDRLGVAKAAVVGHSMGGMLAVRFARSYPDRTTHLALANPIGLEDYRFAVPPRTTEAVYREELENVDVAKIRAFYRGYVVEWKPDVYEPYVAARARVALSGEYPRWAKSAALTYQMIYREPVRHELRLLRVPTLLVIGQEDRTALGRNVVSEEVRRTLGQYPQLGREAAADIPGAKLVELPNVGHIPHLETPERFHRELLDFLGR